MLVSEWVSDRGDTKAMALPFRQRPWQKQVHKFTSTQAHSTQTHVDKCPNNELAMWTSVKQKKTWWNVKLNIRRKLGMKVLRLVPSHCTFRYTAIELFYCIRKVKNLIVQTIMKKSTEKYLAQRYVVFLNYFEKMFAKSRYFFGLKLKVLRNNSGPRAFC